MTLAPSALARTYASMSWPSPAEVTSPPIAISETMAVSRRTSTVIAPAVIVVPCRFAVPVATGSAASAVAGSSMIRT